MTSPAWKSRGTENPSLGPEDPTFSLHRRPIEGVAVCTGPCHEQSLLAPAGLPKSLPVTQGSGSSEAPRVRDQPQDLFTISSSNSKQHSRITHFCFHPSVCGNRDSNAGCGVSQQRRFCLLPQGGSDPGASSTAAACRVVFPHWRALSPGLSSNRIVTKQIRDPWAIHPLAEPG